MIKTKNEKQKAKSEIGQILVLALIFFVVIAFLTLVLFSRVGGFVRFIATSIAKEQATHLAEAGIDYAVWQLNEVSGTPSTDPTAVRVGVGEFKTKVEDIASDKKLITSTGCIPRCLDPKKQTKVIKVEVVKKTTGTFPDTGQTGCWNTAGSPVSCPGTGQDGEYTSANSATCDPSFTDNGNGTVTDNCTSLTWQKCPRGQNPSTCAGTVSTIKWTNALSYCQGLSLAGTGWRMPNFKELQSIVNYQLSTTIDTTIFPMTEGDALDRYWSSTTSQRPSQETEAWGVTFRKEGDLSMLYVGKTFSERIRCVRDADIGSSSAAWQIRRGTYRFAD